MLAANRTPADVARSLRTISIQTLPTVTGQTLTPAEWQKLRAAPPKKKRRAPRGGTLTPVEAARAAAMKLKAARTSTQSRAAVGAVPLEPLTLPAPVAAVTEAADDPNRTETDSDTSE